MVRGLFRREFTLRCHIARAVVDTLIVWPSAVALQQDEGRGKEEEKIEIEINSREKKLGVGRKRRKTRLEKSTPSFAFYLRKIYDGRLNLTEFNQAAGYKRGGRTSEVDSEQFEHSIRRLESSAAEIGTHRKGDAST